MNDDSLEGYFKKRCIMLIGFSKNLKKMSEVINFSY